MVVLLLLARNIKRVMEDRSAARVSGQLSSFRMVESAHDGKREEKRVTLAACWRKGFQEPDPTKKGDEGMKGKRRWDKKGEK